VLRECHARERRRAHGLEPEGADEDDAERDEEREEEESDPAVDDLRAQRAIST